jgi:hypothetical protein
MGHVAFTDEYLIGKGEGYRPLRKLEPTWNNNINVCSTRVHLLDSFGSGKVQ